VPRADVYAVTIVHAGSLRRERKRRTALPRLCFSVVFEILDDGRQLAGRDSKFLRRLERLRLQLQLDRRQLDAPANSFEFEPDFHGCSVNDKGRVFLADSFPTNRGRSGAHFAFNFGVTSRCPVSFLKRVRK
jgi:hypothetical protein